MDWTPFIAPTATVLVFIVGGWIAVKNANNSRFAHIEAEQAAMNARIEQLSEDTKANRDISKQIAALSAKVDDLRADVTKHNSVIERTYRLERDAELTSQRISELRDDLHDMKLGGTK